MRHIVGVALSVVLAFVAMTPALGEEQTKTPMRLSLSSNVVSRYVNYLGYRSSRDPAVQSEFVMMYGRVRTALWWSVGTNDHVLSSDRADQLDASLSWRVQYRRFTVAPELVYQDYIELERNAGDVLIPRLTFSAMPRVHGRSTLSAMLQVEDRLTMPTLDRRPTATLAVSHAFALGHGMTWSIGGVAFYDTGNKKADNGVVMQWKSAFSVALNKRASLQVFGRYVDPMGMSSCDGRTTQSVIGCGLTLSF